MINGCTKELKKHEYRVEINSDNVKECNSRGYTVYIKKNAGVSVDFSNNEYEKAEAIILDNPIYIEENGVHYFAGNMPGAVSHTSTIALTNTTLKYGLLIAANGVKSLDNLDYSIRSGINTFNVECVNMNVAKAYFGV